MHSFPQNYINKGAVVERSLNRFSPYLNETKRSVYSTLCAVHLPFRTFTFFRSHTEPIHQPGMSILNCAYTDIIRFPSKTTMTRA